MRHILIGMMFLIGISALQPAQAQSVREMRTIIAELQQQMQAMQANLSGQSSSEASRMRVMVADMTAKMGVVERQLRALTGRLEELEQRQREQTQALDALRREMDLKFQSLSHVSGAATGQIVSLKQGAQDQVVDGKTAQGETGTAGQPNSKDTKVAAGVIRLPDGDDKTQYDYAFAFVHKQDFSSGVKALSAFIQENPKSKLVPNAHYWLGRVYQRQNKVPLAAAQFLEVVQKYTKSDKYPDALVDLADVLIQLGGEEAQACGILAEFMALDGSISPRLKSRADRLYQQAKCQ